ncbi:MAG: hypothetical protein AB7F35_22240 [Acetobacteraceae bacterium]
MLRPLRLARIAAEAEGARLRALARRTGVRTVVGGVAIVFLLIALSFAHMIIWFWLRDELYWSPLLTATALTGFDLVIAIILGLWASSSKPSREEREALEVRHNAMEEMRASLTWTALLLPGARLAIGMIRRRRG